MTRWTTRRRLHALTTPLVLLLDLVLTVLVVGFCVPLWILPWRAAVVLARLYGLVVGAAWPLSRRTGAINILRAYGDQVSPPQATRRTWTVWSSLGASVAEGLQFARRFKSAQADWKGLYEAEDPDLERQILADPRPKIFVTAHLGSWEVATGIAGLRAGDRGAALARRVDNLFLNALVRRVRLRDSRQWIEKRGGAMVALGRLRRGDSVALLLDENAGPRGVFVDFFGRPASTGRIAGLLAVHARCPIVVGVCIRRPAKPFLFRLALIEPPEEARLDASDTVTRAVVAQLERWVRDDPWQWRWIHWRWKTRPGGSEESYSRRDLAACSPRRSLEADAKQGTLA